MSEAELTEEVAAFLRERTALKAKYNSQWVIFSGAKFLAAFENYEKAARYAFENLRDSTFLVRNLDAADEQVPLIFADVS